MLVRNAIYKFTNEMGVHLYHVNHQGYISIAMDRDARGKCRPSLRGRISPAFFMFKWYATERSNHNHWYKVLVAGGRIVASHVVDPRKLTSRQLRKMARK